MSSKLFPSLCLLLVAAACVLSPGCAEPRRRQAAVESPPPPPEMNPTPEIVTAQNVPNLPAPKPSEAGGAVERVFKGAVTVETDRDPHFVVGDFNGDQSQDIAVAVRPAPGKLPQINDELAAWILVAPAQPVPKDLPHPEAHAEAIKRQRVRVDEGDALLAVIHGFGPDGWRDPQATQTYVLKDSVGGRMKTQASEQLLKDGKEQLPRLRGDVIAQTVGGQTGFLYYNGAKYAWYDSRSYKPEPPARIVHGGSSGMSRQ